jgi:hypothetical protein
MSVLLSTPINLTNEIKWNDSNAEFDFERGTWTIDLTGDSSDEESDSLDFGDFEIDSTDDNDHALSDLDSEEDEEVEEVEEVGSRWLGKDIPEEQCSEPADVVQSVEVEETIDPPVVESVTQEEEALLERLATEGESVKRSSVVSDISPRRSRRSRRAPQKLGFEE